MNRRLGLTNVAVISVAVTLLASATAAYAHPILENGIDVVISPDRIVVDARIGAEELVLIETPDHRPPSTNQWPALAAGHAAYVRNHLHLIVDGHPVTAASCSLVNGDGQVRRNATNYGPPLTYRLEYPLSKPPGVVTIEQDFLRELSSWAVSCELRERQSTEPEFERGLLPSLGTAEFDCAWEQRATSQPTAAPNPTVANAQGNSEVGSRAPAKYGIWRFLTGHELGLAVFTLILEVSVILAILMRSGRIRSRREPARNPTSRSY